MKNFYNNNDITEFLAQQDYGLWTGSIIDKKTCKPRPAQNQDFEGDIKHSFEMIDLYDDKTFKDFEISNFRFAEIVYPAGTRVVKNATSLTINWCSMLLETYGKDYANELQTYCKDSLKNLNDMVTKNATSLTPEKQRKCENVKAFFTKLLGMAQNKIKEVENTTSV